MLKDKDGNRLFRKVTVKVLFPDNIFPEKTYYQHAGPHQGFGPDNVSDMLLSVADKLEELYPWWDFRPIELKPVGRTTRWVFTFAGYRPTPAVSTTPTEASTPATEPAESNPSSSDETPLQELLAQERVPEVVETSRQQGRSLAQEFLK